MSSTTNFDETATAYAQVQKVVGQLRTEHEGVCAEIVATEGELKAAPLAYLPLDDLKAGILDFIDASGMRYAEDRIRTAISDFARNRMSSNRSDAALTDKPMRFIDLERCISGQDGAGSWAQLLTPEKNLFNDQVLYYFAAQLVKQGLANLMADMPPEAFGYGGILPEQIGPDRATRRATIGSLKEKLSGLHEQRKELETKLAALGVQAPI